MDVGSATERLRLMKEGGKKGKDVERMREGSKEKTLERRGFG